LAIFCSNSATLARSSVVACRLMPFSQMKPSLFGNGDLICFYTVWTVLESKRFIIPTLHNEVLNFFGSEIMNNSLYG
jgi:hypothetical protein